MTRLARTLKTTEYFALAFGAMVGVGWLILIDDWLARGGPGGAMLGFLLGGLALIPVAYVYGKFVRAIPDSASELAYATSVFPKSAGFVAAWLMTLAYLIVCPWEAVAIGRLAAYLFPQVQRLPLYDVGGAPVYAPALLLGLISTFVIVILNYRGIRLSARFQRYTTFGLLASFLAFTLLGFTRTEAVNYQPFFAQSGESSFLAIAVSTILVLQIVPYFLTGFESVPKCVEEADENFEPAGFAKAIYLSLAVGVVFYVLIIAVVGGLVPWKSLTTERYATAVAFQRAFQSEWIVRFILLAATFSLLKVFNANFLTASRLVFALGRRGLVAPGLGRIHSLFQTPHNAVLFCGIFTLAGAFLGSSILIPVTEVGSMCSGVGWLVTCFAYMRWSAKNGVTQRKQKIVAVTGAVVASLFVLLKIIPAVPGSFGMWEYVALGGWLLLGFVLTMVSRKPVPA